MHCFERLSCFNFPSKNCISKDGKARCQCGNIFPATHRVFSFPHAGKFFLQSEGRTCYSKDFMLQHHDARTPATVGLKTTEPHSTAWMPATALTRARARTPVTVVPTTEETPAKAWPAARAHRKKRFTSFPSPAGMSLTKLRLGRNNSFMTSLFPPRESLVVTFRLGTGNSRTFFLRCMDANDSMDISNNS